MYRPSPSDVTATARYNPLLYESDVSGDYREFSNEVGGDDRCGRSKEDRSAYPRDNGVLGLPQNLDPPRNAIADGVIEAHRPTSGIVDRSQDLCGVRSSSFMGDGHYSSRSARSGDVQVNIGCTIYQNDRRYADEGHPNRSTSPVYLPSFNASNLMPAGASQLQSTSLPLSDPHPRYFSHLSLTDAGPPTHKSAHPCRGLGAYHSTSPEYHLTSEALSPSGRPPFIQTLPSSSVAASMDRASSMNADQPSWSEPAWPMMTAKRRRATPEQLQVLNGTFKRTWFPSTDERISLAKRLGMSPRRVQIWFQNKRQSAKRSARLHSVASSQDTSIATFQDHEDEGSKYPAESSSQAKSVC